MVGKRPDQTKPTALFVSDDKAARKEAFNLLKGSGIMADYPGFELGHSAFEKLKACAGDSITVFRSQAVPGELAGFSLTGRLARE